MSLNKLKYVTRIREIVGYPTQGIQPADTELLYLYQDRELHFLLGLIEQDALSDAPAYDGDGDYEDGYRAGIYAARDALDSL